MKQIVVITAGTGENSDLSIEAGTTSSDILKQLNLSGYVLSKDNGQHVFGATENVYKEVDDGEKLHVASKADVGLVINI
ncbi:MAG: hypothetical protein ACT6FE_03765 [Methanosarcinaceae archaeon]